MFRLIGRSGLERLLQASTLVVARLEMKAVAGRYCAMLESRTTPNIYPHTDFEGAKAYMSADKIESPCAAKRVASRSWHPMTV